ncbi:MAG: DHH family phosphoesterase, partial [Anaerolineae bacterium]|nr:DHH family phosphoesterase [Anaerolineae bacterium]
KLASALLSRRPTPNLNPVELLDLVAIGTIADMVPLVDENRALVRAGITQIRRPHRQGLMALIGISGLKPERITAGNVGFSLGPRLNAAGRIGSAEDAYELLLSKDVYEAGQLAQVLDNHNRERQKITSEMIERSEEMVLDADPQAKLLFIYDADFNPGVVGLAASRLVDRYYRPAIVAHQGEEYTRASCRSIPEFHITDALQECAELLDHYGGHAAAAGFTVHNRNLAALKERLKAAAQKQLADQDLQPVLNAEAEVQLKDLQVELLEQLDWLEPTGYGNQSPLFVSRGVEVKSSRTVGKDQAHLKLTVSDGWITFDAIGFRLGYWERQLPAKVDLLYAFEINEFNGRKMLQLNVRDLKASQT